MQGLKTTSYYLLGATGPYRVSQVAAYVRATPRTDVLPARPDASLGGSRAVEVWKM